MDEWHTTSDEMLGLVLVRGFMAANGRRLGIWTWCGIFVAAVISMDLPSEPGFFAPEAVASALKLSAQSRADPTRPADQVAIPALGLTVWLKPPGYITVVAVVPGGPADKAGVQINDLIITGKRSDGPQRKGYFQGVDNLVRWTALPSATSLVSLGIQRGKKFFFVDLTMASGGSAPPDGTQTGLERRAAAPAATIVPGPALQPSIGLPGCETSGTIGGRPASLTQAQVQGLANYVGKTYRAGSIILRVTWVRPGIEWQVVELPQFGPALTERYTLSPDGTFSASGSVGWLDAMGLPMRCTEEGGKRLQDRFVQSPAGLVHVLSQNMAKPGKPARWRILAQVLRQEIAPADADALLRSWDDARKARWAGLERLTQGSWYCIQTEPTQWIDRSLTIHQFGRAVNRSAPTSRLTTARWITPWSDLEIRNTLGDGRQATDRITERNDGSVVLNSTGFTNYYSGIVGSFDANNNGVYFHFLDWPWQHGIVYHLTLTYGVGPGPWNTPSAGKIMPRSSMTMSDWRDPQCEMEPFDDKALDRYANQLEAARSDAIQKAESDQRYWIDVGASYAEGQQMLDNMRGQLVRQVVVGIPQAIAEANQQRNELDRLRVAAAEETRLRRLAEQQAATTERAGRSAGAAPESEHSMVQPPAGGQRGATPTPTASRATRGDATAPQPGAQTGSSGGTTGRVYIWCTNMIKDPQRRPKSDVSHVSQIGTAPRTAPFPDVEARSSQQWRNYLSAQNIATGLSSCHLDLSQEQAEYARSNFVGNVAIDGSISEIPWSPKP